MKITGDALFRNNRLVDQLFYAHKYEEIVVHNQNCLVNERSTITDLKLKLESLPDGNSKASAIDNAKDYLLLLGNYRAQYIGSAIHVPLAEIYLKSLFERSHRGFYEIFAKLYNKDFEHLKLKKGG